MSDDFFNASGGGDPVWFQHILWFMGHPEFWLGLVKWLILIIGVIIVGRRLFKAKQFIWLALFSLGIITSAFGIFTLMQNAQQLFIEGRGHEVILLRYVGLFINILTVLTLVWIIKSKIKPKIINKD